MSGRLTEHPVDPIKPKDRPLLSPIGEQFKTIAENFYHEELESVRRRTEEKDVRARAGEAKNFSFELNRFWQYSRDHANNALRFDKTTDKAWLDKTDTILKGIDDMLATQLATWEEVTSPFSDEYDVNKIYDAARELRTTINFGLDTLQPAGMPNATKLELGYRLSLSCALAGLSEQIGSRLSALAAGDPTVKLVTLSRQARELLERAVKDKVGEGIVTEANKAQRLKSDFVNNNYTAEKLTTLWRRHLDLELELKRKDLAPEKRQELQLEHENAARALEVFRTALDLADFSALRKKEITDLREDIKSANQKLGKVAGRSPDELQALRVERDALVTDLIGKEIKFLKEAGIAVAREGDKAGDRQQLYEQQLNDGKTAAKMDQVSHWSDVKKTFLDAVEVVSGKELRETLDNDAFDSSLIDQLNDWNKELKKTSLDPARVQELTSSLAAIITSYSDRAEVALRKERADVALSEEDKTALLEAGDALQAGLSALRVVMAETLKFLLQKGLFT